MLGTNPVVVRRTMAGLREAGYVSSERGHGGCWVIACGLGAVSLAELVRTFDARCTVVHQTRTTDGTSDVIRVWLKRPQREPRQIAADLNSCRYETATSH